MFHQLRHLQTACEVLWNSCGKSGSDNGLFGQCLLDCQRNGGPDNQMCELDKELAVNGRDAKSAGFNLVGTKCH